jgi:glc operon protein GlcG
VTLEQARRAVAAGVKEARKQNLTVAIAVLDASGQLVAFERMDNTQLGSIAVAQDKALTAVLFRRSTKAFENALTGAADAGVWLPLLTLRNVTPIEGGLPVVVNGKVIGSVGASGGRAAQDGLVAQAACDTFTAPK